MVYERDFSSKAGIAAQEYGKEGKYWLDKFSGEISRISFPYDRNQSHVDGFVKEQEVFQFSRSCATQLLELSKSLDHRLYIILAAGLVALLHKYTGSTDIIIGSPIFRQEKETEFINTVLALRHRLQDRMTFKQLLMDQVKPTIIEANQHQNYPIETLLFQLKMPFKKEFPLFDVVILLENIHEKKYILYTRPNIIFSFNRSGDNIQGNLQYNTGLYRQETARGIASHFKQLMEQAVSKVDLPLKDIDIMSEEEKKQVTLSFNWTRVNYPAHKTIHELFADEAAVRPDKAAVTYDGEPVNYSRLEQESDSLAMYLRSQGVKPEEPVALMAENSYKVITALLGILKAGAAYVPVNAEYPGERKQMILDDCHTNLLLTNCQNPGDYVSRVIHLDDSDIYRYEVEKHGGEYSDSLPGHHQGSSPLAYIMYTSGSTGLPRGVMVEHRNVVRLVKNTNFVEFDENDSILLTGALEFDASTFEIWGALLNGLTLHLTQKDTLLSPDQLKQAANRSKATIMWMTSPFFNQVSDMDIEIFKGLKNLLVGGDVLSPPHINRVRKRFPGLKVINGYGPTENTTFSTTFPVDKEYQENIPIGKPINNSFAFILDRNYHLLPIGAVGELFVGGHGLSRGYLNNPELTSEKFINYKLQNTNYKQITNYKSQITNKNKKKDKKVPGKNHMQSCNHASMQYHSHYPITPSPHSLHSPHLPHSPIYKTGDLARWLPDGNIEFLGRIDYQVKIRGYRVEPGEIETRLMQTGYIKEVVVITRESAGGEKYLCAYVVPGKKKKERFDAVELKKELARQLPDYMVPAFLSKVERIPLNPNGKVDHKALPEPDIGAGIDFTAPGNEIENRMADIWAEVLKVEKKVIGIDSDFFQLGGHSLKATIFIAKLHKALNVKIPLAILFETPTIRQLSKYIDSSKVERFTSIAAVEKKDFYELSPAQKRMFILHQMIGSSTTYNIAGVIMLEGRIEKQEFNTSFKKLITRHESLRTSFKLMEVKPVQRVHDNVEFSIDYYDLATEVTENTEAASSHTPHHSFIRPFDLSQAPLLRVGLIKENDQKHTLIVDMHHIISDGMSMEVLVRDFIVLYAGKELPALRLQYKDFVEWQRNPVYQEALIQQEIYWLKLFETVPPPLELPTDFPRPSLQSYEGSYLEFSLGEKETRLLKSLARVEGATLFMVLFALYNILLSRLSGQHDIVVGTPIIGRKHADLENIIGIFINALAFRNYIRSEITFIEFLGEVKRDIIKAFENQDYPFEDLVEKVIKYRHPNRNSLFDVRFNMNSFEILPGEFEKIKLKPYPQEINTSKFDMTLSARETGEILSFGLEYCTKLFKKATIEKFIEYFREIITVVVENPDIKLGDIGLSLDFSMVESSMEMDRIDIEF